MSISTKPSILPLDKDKEYSLKELQEYLIELREYIVSCPDKDTENNKLLTVLHHAMINSINRPVKSLEQAKAVFKESIEYMTELSKIRDKIGDRIKKIKDSQPEIEKKLTAIKEKIKAINDELKKESEKKREEYLEKLKSSRGKLSAKEFLKLLDDEEEYKALGIESEKLKNITEPIDCTIEIDANGQRRSTVDILDRDEYEKGSYTIPEGCLEIYFWGLPKSGKTCCLAAILSGTTTSDNAGEFNLGGNGTRYFKKLRGIMKKDDISILPARTTLNSLAYAGFKLYDPKKKHYRQLCLIDLPGEIVQYYAELHDKPRTGAEDNTTDEAKKLNYEVTRAMLKNKNRKLHFFVIPYPGDNKDLEVLESCVNYLNNNEIIENTTNGIYIIVTKTDMMGNADIEKTTEEYVQHNFGGFLNGLTNLCIKESINKEHKDNPVEIIPFSIGTLLTTESCLFNTSKGTQKILDIFRLKAPFVKEKRRGLQRLIEKLQTF